MIRRMLQTCSALVALAAGLVGVPWALISWGPLPTEVPSVDRASALVTNVVSDTALFAVLTWFAWAAWLVFVTCVVVELTATLRGVSTPRLPGAGVLQLWAARLVAALLLSFTVVRPAGASTATLRAVSGVPGARPAATRLDVAATSPQVVTAATVPEPGTEASRTVASSAPPIEETTTPGVVTVEPGDSAWALAERYLHDGMRWRELWESNRDRRQPDGATWKDPELLLPGWQLQLPADPSPVGSRRDPHLYTVVPGDDLSDIAARVLGDSALAGALFDTNRGRVQPDGDSLTDPNLIRPGWLLTLPDEPAALQPTSPPTSAATPEATPAAAANGASAAPTPTAEQPATHPSPPSSLPRTTGQRTAERGSSRSGPTVAPRPRASSPTVATTTPLRNRDAARAARNDGIGNGGHAVTDGGSVLGARVPFLAGIGGATVLATGLAVWLGRLRRRRSARGARHFARRPHDTQASSSTLRDTERAVFAAADVPLARWAGHVLASLSDGQPANGATPMVVELSAGGGLELLWDIPCPVAPGSWEVLDHGWAWRVPFDPEAPLPHDPARVMVPGLVTIGRRDDRQLLVDLEAFGTMAVVGDPVRVEDFLRAVVLELAAGDELSDAYVATVDVPCDGSEHGGRVTSVDAAGALARLSAAASAVGELLDQHATTSTFAYRATEVNAPPLETTVVVARVDDVDTVEAMRAVVGPGRGVAAMFAGEAVAGGGTAARVVLDADGSSCLEPLGLRFSAVGLPGATAASLVELFTAEAVVPDDVDCDDTVEHSLTQGAALSLARDSIGVEAGVEGGDVDASMVGADGSASGGPESSAGLAAPGSARLESSDEDRLSSRDVCGTAGSGLLVRVFGVPSVPDRPGLGRREVQLTVFLACRDRPANTASVQDALWNGQAMSTKTMWNLVARTRAKLGTFPDGRAVLPPADRVQGTLHLARGVLTDLAVLRDCYEQALQASSGQGIDVLRHGMSLVDGPPFDAPGYDWAYHGEQWVADASMLIEQATVLLVELQLAAGDLDGARVAVTRGLRGLPGNEVLYRWRMRIEQQAGNLAAVRSAYRELLSFLDDLDAEPSLATCALYEELVGTGPRSRV